MDDILNLMVLIYYIVATCQGMKQQHILKVIEKGLTFGGMLPLHFVSFPPFGGRSRFARLSVNKNVLIKANDKAGLEHLVQYISRCPFSLERIIKLTDTDHVIYKAEHKNCRRFPDPGDEKLKAGVNRKLTLTSFAPDLWSDGLALLGFRSSTR